MGKYACGKCQKVSVRRGDPMKIKPGAIARVVVTLLFAISMTSSDMAHSQSQKNFAQARREFNTVYEQSMRKHGIVGSGFLLIQDREVIAQEFFGLADIEKKEPVDEDTIFHWASITKTFTGVAIMQLRDRGLLKLDDPIIKYLQELQSVNIAFG